jgi:iron complex outermembrane receptor protein
MFLRLGISVLLIIAAFFAKAQGDSIVLKPVYVYGLPVEKYLAGSQVVPLDTALKTQQESRHLGELLSFQFPIYFRNYGNGMLSGISMRGSSPQQVAVRWNGININSFSLGQADFSILPAVAFDEVKVHSGGGSALFGSGAIGGSILLSSSGRPQLPVSVSQEVGSFGRYFTSLQTGFVQGRFSSSSSFYHLQSENDFPVEETGQRQSHAAFKQQGFVQRFEFDIASAKKLTINYWYHDADRDIQPTIGNTTSTDEQSDRNHRLSVSYEQNNTLGLLSFSGGIVNDRIVYNGVKSEVFRWIASAGHQYTFTNGLNLSFRSEWNHIIGKIEEYGLEEPVEDRIDLSASLQKTFKKISASANIRKPFITDIDAPLLPYLGVSILLLESSIHQLNLNANVSRNFRAPTLNDRYWKDVGRMDLQPETSHAAEVGIDWKLYKKYSIAAAFFGQEVEDWIQWVPGADGMYRPQNIKEVGTSGIETSAQANATSGPFLFRARATYQYTRSVTKETHDADQESIGKQLIYAPLHTGAANLGGVYKTWSMNFYLQYSGKRYTDASNSPVYALDPFALVDFSMGKSWLQKRHRLDFYILVKNLFDTTYQLYSGRAMPGRNFNFKITYQLKHKTNESTNEH